MKPVYQDEFGHGKGNCAWACVASIFEMSLDDLRYPAGPSHDELREWTAKTFPGLTMHDRDLGTNFRLEGGYEDVAGLGTQRWTYDLPDEWEPPVERHWLASIFSPQLKRPVADPYYPMPALHMVVMKGGTMVHDPNPNYADRVPYMTTLVMQTWWTGPDFEGVL